MMALSAGIGSSAPYDSLAPTELDELPSVICEMILSYVRVTPETASGQQMQWQIVEDVWRNPKLEPAIVLDIQRTAKAQSCAIGCMRVANWLVRTTYIPAMQAALVAQGRLCDECIAEMMNEFMRGEEPIIDLF